MKYPRQIPMQTNFFLSRMLVMNSTKRLLSFATVIKYLNWRRAQITKHAEST